jgi:hypothetical protein
MKKLAVAIFLILIAASSVAQSQDKQLADLSVSSIPFLPDRLEQPAQSPLRPVELRRGVPPSVPECVLLARCSGSASFVLSSAAADAAPADSGGGSIQPIVRTPESQPSEAVQWKSLARQSSFYLGIMHGFRIATEPGTRSALHNSVFGGYFEALGSLHGWSDGDGHYENYLGHPLQGAVSGYLWVHNDPRYRAVEFGSSRDYWMSRLRAYAFAWAFSEQFEIGLLSEASIGQIQRYCCAYGFVDHVITPNAGLGMMVGMDAVDKYVTRRIEDRTRNTAIRIIARVALNPTQSFANLMAFQAPWHRENRPGILAYDGEAYAAVRPAEIPRNSGSSEVPRFELTATVPSFFRFGGLSCIGGGGIGAFRLTDVWEWTLQVDGCALRGLRENWHGDSLTFATGPQWTSQAAGRWSPHVHMRVGGHKVTEQQGDAAPADGAASSPQRDADSNPSPRQQPDRQYETTGFSLSIGGGMDIKLNRALSLQLANLEYVHSWLGNLNDINLNKGFRVSTGLVLRVGTW